MKVLLSWLTELVGFRSNLISNEENGYHQISLFLFFVLHFTKSLIWMTHVFSRGILIWPHWLLNIPQIEYIIVHADIVFEVTVNCIS